MLAEPADEQLGGFTVIVGSSGIGKIVGLNINIHVSPLNSTSAEIGNTVLAAVGLTNVVEKLLLFPVRGVADIPGLGVTSQL